MKKLKKLNQFFMNGVVRVRIKSGEFMEFNIQHIFDNPAVDF